LIDNRCSHVSGIISYCMLVYQVSIPNIHCFLTENNILWFINPMRTI